jgi:hypothetical protein
MKKELPANIQVTSLKHDLPGAVMFMHCSECKRTVIMLSEYAVRPHDGDAWYLTEFCDQLHAFSAFSLDPGPHLFRTDPLKIHGVYPQNSTV